MLTKAEQYVRDLYDFGRRSFDDLEIEERHSLTGFIMWGLDDGARFEFISEPKNADDLTKELMRYLVSATHNLQADSMSAHDNQEDCAADLLLTISVNAVKYAESRINKLFDAQHELREESIEDDNHADRI